jgi:hypothetical protein
MNGRDGFEKASLTSILAYAQKVLRALSYPSRWRRSREETVKRICTMEEAISQTEVEARKRLSFAPTSYVLYS